MSRMHRQQCRASRYDICQERTCYEHLLSSSELDFLPAYLYYVLILGGFFHLNLYTKNKGMPSFYYTLINIIK